MRMNLAQHTLCFCSSIMTMAFILLAEEIAKLSVVVANVLLAVGPIMSTVFANKNNT